jgi:hypothetical protein
MNLNNLFNNPIVKLGLGLNLKRLSYKERLEKVGLYYLKINNSILQNCYRSLNKVEYVATNRAAPDLNSTGPAANIRGHTRIDLRVKLLKTALI